jgi:hypothetical protein
MSLDPLRYESLRSPSWVSSVQKSVFRVAFGDRVGFFVFVLAVTFVATFWRLDIAINDTETLANGVAALSDGHLAFRDPPFGTETGQAPGTVFFEGSRYARLYGLVVPATGVSLVLYPLAAIFELRVLIVGAWSVLLLLGSRELSRFTRRKRSVRILGIVIATGSFGANVALGTPIPRELIPVLALQLWTLLACGLAATISYRLFASTFSRSTAAVIGAGMVVATPLGFWSTIPKRHVIVALAVLVVAYTFTLTPDATGDRRRLLRTVPYVVGALLVWVHAADGPILLVSIVVVDAIFGHPLDRRQVGITAGLFAVALVPWLVTNYLISGNPVQPPQFLPDYQGQPIGSEQPEGLAEQGAATMGPDSGTRLGRDSSGPLEAIAGRVVRASETVLSLLSLATKHVGASLEIFVQRPGDVYQTFVRSGFVRRAALRGSSHPVHLSYLESFPMAATAVLGISQFVRERVNSNRVARLRNSVLRDADAPTRVTGFALTYFALMLAFYQHRLPLHSMFTVRYLVPTMPLALYVSLRYPPLRNVLESERRILGLSYLLTVLAGGELITAYLMLTSHTLGERVQLHALLGLGMASMLFAWGVIATHDVRWWTREQWSRVGAVIVGVAAGLTTVFLLLTGWQHFPYGEYAIPIFDALSELLRS